MLIQEVEVNSSAVGKYVMYNINYVKVKSPNLELCVYRAKGLPGVAFIRIIIPWVFMVSVLTTGILACLETVFFI